MRAEISIILLTLTMFPGCGSTQPARASTVPASGVVIADGKPLANVSVIFKSKGGPAAHATTDADGKFRLSTYETGDGAIPGEYRIAIVPALAHTRPASGRVPVRVPSRPQAGLTKYSNSESSGLIQVIPASGSSTLRIELAQ